MLQSEQAETLTHALQVYGHAARGGSGMREAHAAMKAAFEPGIDLNDILIVSKTQWNEQVNVILDQVGDSQRRKYQSDEITDVISRIAQAPDVSARHAAADELAARGDVDVADSGWVSRQVLFDKDRIIARMHQRANEATTKKKKSRPRLTQADQFYLKGIRDGDSGARDDKTFYRLRKKAAHAGWIAQHPDTGVWELTKEGLDAIHATIKETSGERAKRLAEELIFAEHEVARLQAEVAELWQYRTRSYELADELEKTKTDLADALAKRSRLKKVMAERDEARAEIVRLRREARRPMIDVKAIRTRTRHIVQRAVDDVVKATGPPH